ncbi:MAG: right-handed parallel beta-helix repeat-containing protein [Bacteroidota bacterium]
MQRNSRLILLAAALSLMPPGAGALTVFHVSTWGNDTGPGTASQPWRTIGKALLSLSPGDTCLISGGTYREKPVAGVSGSAGGGFISLMPSGDDSVTLDGTGIAGPHMLLVPGRSYLRIRGLTFCNNFGVTDGGGIRLEGSGSHVELLDNTIHTMRGTNAMGITVYGTSGASPYADILIADNRIFACDAAPSEALVLNGNVEGFEVRGNLIHDVNNIGIDFIGGEGTCPVPSLDRARRGVCRGNTVFRARSSYGDGYAAGIYVDGGSNILIEHNSVSRCDLGIEVGCENRYRVADSIVVRNNMIYRNDKRGLSWGGYDYPRTGTVRHCLFRNNTLFLNDSLGTGDGEVFVEHASECRFEGNIVRAGAGDRMMTALTLPGSSGRNIWFGPGGAASALFVWGGTAYTGFGAFRSGTGQDAGSAYADPLFADGSPLAPDLHIQGASPAAESGDPRGVPEPGETDWDGEPRLMGLRLDAGADELTLPIPVPLLVSPPDGAGPLPPTVTLIWTGGPPGSLFHLQVASDTAFSLLLADDSALGVPTREVGPLPGGTAWGWRVRAGHGGVFGEWSPPWGFSVSSYGVVSCTLLGGWNMVSVPLRAFDWSPARLFPPAVSPAYAFHPYSGYAASDTLSFGRGYWLRFPGPEEVMHRGLELPGDSLPLAAGWNIVGSGPRSIPVEHLTPVPPGILGSSFYVYGGTYAATDTLRPGMGAWVRAHASGVLILPPGPHPALRSVP